MSGREMDGDTSTHDLARVSSDTLVATSEEHKMDAAQVRDVASRTLDAWNATQQSYSRDACVQELVALRAASAPDAAALVADNRVLTYRELNQLANQLAHHLRALGVGPDQLVAVCMERSLDLVVAQLGVLKAG